MESFNSAELHEIGREADVSRMGGLWEFRDANAASGKGLKQWLSKKRVCVYSKLLSIEPLRRQ